MHKSIYKAAFLLIIILTGGRAYAEDIRYAYCTSNFLVHDGGNSVNPVRQDIIRLFSPIFMVDVHDKGVSSLDFSSSFESTVLKDSANAKDTFAYDWVKNVGLHQKGCNFTAKTLQEAQKIYDKEYLEGKNFKPQFQDRCKFVGVYAWTPEQYRPLYPNIIEAEAGYKALVQGCMVHKPVRYKTSYSPSQNWFE